MAKPSAERFVELVERSGLVARDRIERLRALLADQQTLQADDLAARLVAEAALTRWQADRLLEGRHRGFFVKRYKLLDHLGTGGMSSVYLAEHTLMRRRVALKVLPRNRIEDPAYQERFLREAQAAAALDHRNIVRAYDVDKEGDTQFLVMEYIEGRNLQTLVRQEGPLDYAVAADFVRQAAEGLAHAHAAGLIHRDVKPANLLVDQNHVVKVLDLGLARFTSDENVEAVTAAYGENVLGTADFLAPEQAIDSHRVDARADIYSLGCSFYYLLSGQPPFGEGTLPQRLVMHQKHAPPSLFKMRPGAPEDLVAIAMKMMAKRPEDRPQSAREAADLLADWLVRHGYAIASSASGGKSIQMIAASAGYHGAEAVRKGAKELARAARIGPPPLDPPPAREIPQALSAGSEAGETRSGQGQATPHPVVPLIRPRRPAHDWSRVSDSGGLPIARLWPDDSAQTTAAETSSPSVLRGLPVARPYGDGSQSDVRRPRQSRIAIAAMILAAIMLAAILALFHFLSV